MEELARLYGSNIEAGRKHLGMTQVALAKACDVAQQTVSSWEKGETVPRDRLKVKVATVLHQDVRQLFPLTRMVA